MDVKLVIDAGNTRLKLGVFEKSDLLEVCIFADELTLSRKLANYPASCPVIISNVGAWKLHSAVAKFEQSVWLNLATKLPFKMAYKTPETLGNDRRALAAAAMATFPAQNVLVVDLGTCVTCDFLDASNAYQGGAIAPGLAMRLKSLMHFTAKLPLIEYDHGKVLELIGNSTANSMLSGSVLGLQAEVEKTIERYQQRFSDLSVVLTGGDHSLLAHLTKNGIFARPNFLLTGLHYILESNA